jgi:hypothetical protein
MIEQHQHNFNREAQQHVLLVIQAQQPEVKQLALLLQQPTHPQGHPAPTPTSHRTMPFATL